ncbi:MAG: hypothetical protein AAFQ82_27220, partial [Myxococcota bacterium]
RRDRKSGPVVAFNETGQVLTQGTLSNGKRDGRWREFFPNGQLRFDARFVSDLPVGNATEYDESGRVLRKVKFPNRPLQRGQIALYRDSFGVRHGTYVGYHPDGTKASEQRWELGKLVDEKRWDESGARVER